MEKPLLVSVPLIKPIQQRIKTVTRRLAGLDKINEQPDRFSFVRMEVLYRREIYRAIFLDCDTGKEVKVNSPYGGKGTTLWVRENWYVGAGYDGVKPINLPRTDQVRRGYMADGDKPGWAGKTRPGIHLPRWMSRILLTNEDTYPEPLAAITEESAKAEGVPMAATILAREKQPYRYAFFQTFKQLNGPGIQEANPWVWVVKFTLKTPNDGTETPTDTPGN